MKILKQALYSVAIIGAASLQAVELITSDGAWTRTVVSTSNGGAQENSSVNGIFSTWAGFTYNSNNETQYLDMQATEDNPQQHYKAGYTYHYRSTSFSSSPDATNQVAYLLADGYTVTGSRISGPNSSNPGSPSAPNTISGSFAVATGDAIIDDRIGLRLTSEGTQSRFKPDGLSGVSALLTDHANFNGDGVIYSTSFTSNTDGLMIATDHILDMTLAAPYTAGKARPPVAGYIRMDIQSNGTKNVASFASESDTFREDTTYKISFSAQKTQNNDNSQMDLSFELGNLFTTNITVGTSLMNYEFDVDASAAEIAGQPLSIKITPAGAPEYGPNGENLTDYFQLHVLQITAIPEPSSYALLAGCIGLTWVMLRRRRSSACQW